MERPNKVCQHSFCGDCIHNCFDCVIRVLARQFWPVLGSDVQHGMAGGVAGMGRNQGLGSGLLA